FVQVTKQASAARAGGGPRIAPLEDRLVLAAGLAPQGDLFAAPQDRRGDRRVAIGTPREAHRAAPMVRDPARAFVRGVALPDFAQTVRALPDGTRGGRRPGRGR